MSIAPAVLEQVLLPLVEGGELRPVPPIGSKRALEHAEHADFSGESANLIQWRRLRVARRLCAVDRLPALGRGEWLLAFGLNDLLQATNPDLVGVFGRDRPTRLIAMAREAIEHAGAPATLGEAIGRHATFSRLLEIVRMDTHLSWWVGSQTFRGTRPPQRLLRWQSVRRVRESREEVSLPAMALDSARWSGEWNAALARLVAASPLTDLSTVLRSGPEFSWTGASLALLGNPVGRSLARRALDRAGSKKKVEAALEAAAKRLREVLPHAAEQAEAFAHEAA